MYSLLQDPKTFIRKNAHIAERKLKGGPLGFFNIHSVAKILNNEGGPLVEKIFEEKSHNAEKNWKGTL